MKPRRILAPLALVVSAVVPVGSAAGAVTSTVSTQGWIGNNPVVVGHTLPSNTKDGSAQPIGLHNFGDDSLAEATLNGTAGSLIINAHACSGPPLGNPGGRASANGTVNYFENFVIVSDMLPNGTPVSIDLRLAAARSFRTVVNQPFPIRLGTATVIGEAFVSFNNGVEPVIFRGGFASQKIDIEPVFRTMSGILGGVSIDPADPGGRNAGESSATIAGVVGGPFSINIGTSIGATSGAGNPVESDADAQLTLAWGADIASGLARIVPPGGGEGFPSTGGATDDVALALLPPGLGVPEPSTLALLIAAAATALLGRLPRQSAGGTMLNGNGVRFSRGASL